MGIATDLIFLIVGKVFELSEHIGIRYVSVDSYTDSVGFYKKRYFSEFIHDGKRKTVQMYLDVLRLEKYLNKIEILRWKLERVFFISFYGFFKEFNLFFRGRLFHFLKESFRILTFGTGVGVIGLAITIISFAQYVVRPL
jgi:hypothetical protein